MNEPNAVTAAREILGPVRQVGYIVADIEDAALDWVRRAGVGPWRVKHGIKFDECTYRGKAIDVEVNIASSYSNGLEIELIAQPWGEPSMYSDFLTDSGAGAQHICFYPTDYSAGLAHLLDAGMHVELDGLIRGIEFAYLSDGAGQLIEIADVPADGLAARIERATTAATWDGTEPFSPN